MKDISIKCVALTALGKILSLKPSFFYQPTFTTVAKCDYRVSRSLCWSVIGDFFLLVCTFLHFIIHVHAARTRFLANSFLPEVSKAFLETPIISVLGKSLKKILDLKSHTHTHTNTHFL